MDGGMIGEGYQEIICEFKRVHSLLSYRAETPKLPLVVMLQYPICSFGPLRFKYLLQHHEVHGWWCR